MTKAIAIEIFQVSISYRVLPSRKGATHLQLSIEKTRLVMLTWDTPEQTTLSGDISGAPNENIVQNHINIALLNVL